MAAQVAQEFPVKRSILLTPDPIDEPALTAGRVFSDTAGAVVCFTGCVRNREAERPLAALEYEAFPAMAIRQFEHLLDQAAATWPLQSVEVVHRTGIVRAGEASVWIRVVGPHRAEALAACGWILDEMKRVVPIWKRPIWDSETDA